MKESINHHERALVGMAIAEPTAIDRMEVDLACHLFADDVCAILWPQMTLLRREGCIPDAVALIAHSKGQISAADIGQLVRDAGVARNFAYHVAEIAKHDARNALTRAFRDGMHALDEELDPETVLESFHAALRRVPTSRPTSRAIGELVRAVFEDSRGPKITGTPMPTGFSDLDVMTGGGFAPGEFIVVGARPSIGKSTFAAQIALNIAHHAGPVLFCSLEMPAKDVARRIVAGETSIPFDRLRNGPIGQDEFSAGLRQCGKYTKCPLYISDVRRQTVQGIVSQVRQHASGAPLRAVFVDYIGLIASTDKRKPMWEHITEVSFELKSLAIAESIPVIAVCQLNRDSEEEIPKLSHLRNSGSIEQDADIVILLHRESRGKSTCKVLVPKSRNGKTGQFEIGFDGARYRFETMMQEWIA